MYRTPGRESNIGGRSSRGASPTSNYGSMRSTVLEGQDRVIKHLKKELTGLKRNSKGLHETTARLTNMQHKYNIILGEKARDEDSHRQKEQEQEILLNKLSDEVRHAKELLNKKDDEVGDMRLSYQKLEHIVSTKEELLAQIERDLQSEFSHYQIYLEDKNKLEMDKGSLVKEQVENFTNVEGLSHDIDVIRETVTKVKRTAKEHRSSLNEVKTANLEIQSEVYKAEEELKNLVVNQKSKEAALTRLNDKANVIESDIALLEGEKENLRQGLISRDDNLKHLADSKADHMRRETVLVAERNSVDQSLEDSERELGHQREQIAHHENQKLSGQTEIKGLRSLLDRLMSDNRKLVEALRTVSEADERAIRGLDRREKIDNVIQQANREIVTAMKTIRD